MTKGQNAGSGPIAVEVEKDNHGQLPKHYISDNFHLRYHHQDA